MSAMNGDLLQSDGWERSQRALGRKTERVGGILAIEMPLPFGLRYWYAPRSGASGELIVDSGELLDRAAGIIRGTDAVFLRAEFGSELSPPKADPPLAETINYQLSTPLVLRRAVEPEWTWRVDLASSEEELLTAMRPKHRYNIRVAERQGVVARTVIPPSSSRAEPQRSREISDRPEISPLRPDAIGTSVEMTKWKNDFVTCWNLLQETAQRQEIATHPRQYYETMLASLAKCKMQNAKCKIDDTDCLLYIAERNGEPLAVAIVAHYGDTATYLHGGSSYEHRAFMAPHLLHWQAMRDAKAAGMRWYDWGGIEPPKTEERRTQNGEPVLSSPSFRSSVLRSVWSGMTRFKHGFGGEAVHHPPTMDLVFRPNWYRLLSLLARLRN
ncbi:peptidoglycan bridge formation glycyltransferase FemA/FemB family protein [Candidatus Uhrbacteria bacterium]|nr:peptidoglycan bridge formation glycyltransferase FemA/FemB family protein [Candidatus Uhrbacteria bacterium]